MDSSPTDNVMNSSTVDNIRISPPIGNDFVKKFIEDRLLHQAIQRRDLYTINYVMSSEKKNFREPETASSVIQLALNHKNLDILELLIKAGVHKSSKRNLKLTTLKDLCWIKNVNVLRALVALIKDLNQQDALQKTMLYYAVEANNLALVKTLLKRNVDVSIVINDFDETVLHYACATHAINIEIIKAFVASGADFDVQCASGRTAFFRALEVAKHDVVWHIMTHAKPSITAQFEDGPTALHYAATNEHVDMVEALIDLGLKVNCKARPDKKYDGPEKGYVKPLKMAKRFGQSQVYEYLIYRGATWEHYQFYMNNNNRDKPHHAIEMDKQVIKATALRAYIIDDKARNIRDMMGWRNEYRKFNLDCHLELSVMRREMIRRDLSVFQLIATTPKEFLKYYDESPSDLIDILEGFEEVFPIYISYFKNTILREVQKEFRKRRAEKIITHFLDIRLNHASLYITREIVKHMTPFDLIYFNDASCMDIINLSKRCYEESSDETCEETSKETRKRIKLEEETE